MRRVRLGDGVRIDLADGTAVVADPTRPDGDVTLLSHAHGDHLPSRAPPATVCSPATAAFAAQRRDLTLDRTRHPAVETHVAGHVAGSRAFVIEDPADGTRYCYTGDVSTRDRLFLDGFDPGPIDADVLITEATYGRPRYRFPPQAAVEDAIQTWLAETMDRPVLLFGYAFGKAQKLLALLDRSVRDRVYVSDAIADLNGIYADVCDVTFDADRSDDDRDLHPGDALVLPSQTSRFDFVDRLREETGALTAGFSGWAADRGFRYRRGHDEAFVLSDHCDFAELTAMVDAIDPDRVLVQHGFADDFARHLTGLGYDATALKRDQSTFADF